MTEAVRKSFSYKNWGGTLAGLPTKNFHAVLVPLSTPPDYSLILLVIATVDLECIDVFEERGFVVARQLCDRQ